MHKTAKKRAEQKRKLIELLGGKCEVCGYNRNAAALDFHHRDPDEKDAFIGHLINFHKFEQAYEEAKKCTILCKVCHTEHHNPDLEIKVSDNGDVHYINQELDSIVKTCSECGEYSGGMTFCSQECAKLSQRKVKNRPSEKELNELLKSMSKCAIGKKFGVSEAAIRKWVEASKQANESIKKAFAPVTKGLNEHNKRMRELGQNIKLS